MTVAKRNADGQALPKQGSVDIIISMDSIINMAMIINPLFVVLEPKRRKKRNEKNKKAWLFLLDLFGKYKMV